MVNYFDAWWKIIVRPIYFFTKLKEENWREKALTFLIQTAWILAVIIALAIFIIQYIPIGATLVEGIAGAKFLIILPVLVTLALVFLLITVLILGGALVLALGVGFYLIALCLHLVFSFWGGKSTLERAIQSIYYSSAVIIAVVFPVIFALLTKFSVLTFQLFRVGTNFFAFLSVLYLYGLWAVIARRNYGVPKWQAFAGALVPVIILLICLMIFDKIALSKVESWITPLK